VCSSDLAESRSDKEFPMNITVFNGSPRAEKGNTHFMVEAFLKGAREAGAETENIFLAKQKIKPCLGCFCCWVKTTGECVIKDDMAELRSKYVAADIVVFATPLYVDNVTGIMKNFMDRLVPLADPYFEKDENGQYRHVKGFDKIQKIAVISNCGFPEQEHFQVLRLLFKRIARNFHSEVIAEIYRGGGGILLTDHLLLKPLLWKYKKLLERAGKEVAENMRLPEATREELEKPLIPHDMYMKGANKEWDKLLNGIRPKA
jgi:multimeric flavodoxin WrbA